MSRSRLFATIFACVVYGGCAVSDPNVNPKISFLRPEATTLPAPLSQARIESVGFTNNYTISPSAALSDALYSRLVAELQSDNAARRTCAATDMAQLKKRQNEVILHLSHALRFDASKWVRRAAAKSLGKIGTRDVIGPLTAALSDRDKWVAHSAANALQRLRARGGHALTS